FFGVPSLPPQLAQQLLDPVASPRRLLGQLALQQLNGPRGPLVPGPDPLEEALVVVDHRALLRRLLAPEHSPEPLPGDPPLGATPHLAHVSRSFTPAGAPGWCSVLTAPPPGWRPSAARASARQPRSAP